MKYSKVFNIPNIFEQETEYCASTSIDYEVFIQYSAALKPIEYVLRDKWGTEYNFNEFSYNDQKRFLAEMAQKITDYLKRYGVQMQMFLADEKAS